MDEAVSAADAARNVVLSWSDTFEIVETTPEIMIAAVDLANDHQLGIWDAVILCVASRSGCRLLLSEDLQDGFTWAGVTVVNPLAAPPNPLLAPLLGRSA